MEEIDYEFYSEIKKVGTTSLMVIIPKNIIKVTNWEEGNMLRLRAKKHISIDNIER